MSKWLDKVSVFPGYANLSLVGVLAAILTFGLHHEASKEKARTNDLRAILDSIEKDDGNIHLQLSREDIARLRELILINPELLEQQIPKAFVESSFNQH